MKGLYLWLVLWAIVMSIQVSAQLYFRGGGGWGGPSYNSRDGQGYSGNGGIGLRQTGATLGNVLGGGYGGGLRVIAPAPRGGYWG
ncbi:uncharacterized protein LOC128960882 [Oppia nitens]|uniref:uncharacterized protein LOC128960882 n=1 Tax=Oppia nitens TaxID=1686743 RepID=UPI0023D98588|nr:uncharacterized protein LOC128960882 [Oppia nitens]XP_054163014.1 uncharacterized protein LOC128960882 [Oppia nitens]